jgi:phosphoglycolate phosphatase
MTPAFVFDLDGTLVDSAPDLCSSLNVVLRREGKPEMALADMPQLIGNGVRKLIERAFIRSGTALDAPRLDALYDDFVTVYTAHLADETKPYPGAIETLEALKAEGARLAVLTNKTQDAALKVLEALDMTRFFPVILGGGSRDYLKPDPRLLHEVIAELGGGPAAMIGDSRPDVETARNAGAPSVLVTYGYSTEPHDALGADALVDSFSEIPAAVARLFAE